MVGSYIYIYKWEREVQRADNKTQARALCGRLKADLREEKYFPEKFNKPKALTLRMAITRHLDGSTNRNLVAEKIYGRYWTSIWDTRLIPNITTEDCRSHQAKLQAQGKWKPATINRHFAFLRHVLMIALQDGKLTRNPVSGVKFFPEANRVRFFSDDELRHLHGLIDPSNWKVVAFALETGLRRSEQFQLRWEHISFESRTLTIPLPKGGRTRHVPLSQDALVILRSLDSFLSSPWVFPGLKSTLQPMDSRAFLRRAFEPALKKAGMQDASWHTLRHTTASRLVMAGVPLPTVKEVLGHRDIQTTLRYAHLAPSHIQAAMEKGSLVNLGLGTGSKTGSDVKESEEEKTQVVDFIGAPDRNRTCNPWIRSPILYPIELRAHAVLI
jgi:integrase